MSDDYPPALDDPEQAREALADVPGEEGEPSSLPDAAPLRLPDDNPDVETEL
ncbi:MAG: hypothetical protein M3295_06600 [Chloroflexota bacterium]|nr:hypothetical protein [Chloroflexota bacterium]